MSGSLRVLFTNNTLAGRAGTELWVRDVALALQDRGHRPVAFTWTADEVARELRAATIPVVDDLRAAPPPDVVHGHHHLETMHAVLHHPGVPAIFVCHGWLPWQEAPPRFPRIRRYLAVDETCRDRLTLEHGIPEAQVRVLPNFVDLDRFRPRAPLPARPARALVYGNAADEHTYVPAVRTACTQLGIALDVVGAAAGTATDRPEAILGAYDVVFAKGRSALEAMATGAAVVLCDVAGMGPLVTRAEVDRLRRLNFGLRARRWPIAPDLVRRELARYDAADAAAVSRHIRAVAGRDAVVDALLGLYREVIAEQAADPPDAAAEAAATAAYFAFLGPCVKRALAEVDAREHAARAHAVWLAGEMDRLGRDHAALGARLGALEAERDRLQRELVQAGAAAEHALGVEQALDVERAGRAGDVARWRADVARLTAALDLLEGTATHRLRARVLANPALARLARALAPVARWAAR